MAYGLVHHFAGGTKEQYEATLAVVHPGGGLPEGQLTHLAGPSADGWVVTAVHDSKESWEKFRDGTLMPALQSGIEEGLTGPPDEIAFDVVVDQSA